MTASSPCGSLGLGPESDCWGPRPAADPPGPVLFARYAYPPNSLGYCGPGDPSALLEAAADGTDVVGLGHLAARFEGAWPYLQLLCLLYTSDAADEEDSVDLGGRRVVKKK